MPKKGHTEEQIVAVLRQVEVGARVAELCREVGSAKRPTICGSDSTPVWE